MPSNIDPTQQLLKNYHDASQRISEYQQRGLDSDEQRKLHQELAAASRQLVSRSILSYKPAMLVYLAVELATLMRLLGQVEASQHLSLAGALMASSYAEKGTF